MISIGLNPPSYYKVGLRSRSLWYGYMGPLQMAENEWVTKVKTLLLGVLAALWIGRVHLVSSCILAFCAAANLHLTTKSIKCLNKYCTLSTEPDNIALCKSLLQICFLSPRWDISGRYLNTSTFAHLLTFATAQQNFASNPGDQTRRSFRDLRCWGAFSIRWKVETFSGEFLDKVHQHCSCVTIY